ncbi:MAG TPA: PqqD family protein [Anaerolineaceae bacterium]|nr:PqqD family protein [Anaerolineaceae bacterium]
MKLAKDILLRKVGEEAVILDLASQRYFALDEVAADMLSSLLETETNNDALEKLVLKYDAPWEEIRADLEEIRLELLGQGIIG